MSDCDSVPVAVDLFCGAGGMGLGLHQAAYDVIAGVDHDETALQTYNENLSGEPKLHDLSDVDPSILPAEDFDLIHGSPPCQGFSSAGSACSEHDERSQLVWSFIDWIEALQPKTVTMENVTGMVTVSSTLMDRITGAYRDAGYDTKWKILNAADYGVPQTRQRVFLIGVRKDLNTPSRWFPEPTHAETATTTLDGRELKEWPTVSDAIGDLAEQNDEDSAHQAVADGGKKNHIEQNHAEETRRKFAKLEWGSTGTMSTRRLHPNEPSHTITADEGAAVPPVHYIGAAPNHDPRPGEDRHLGGAADHPSVTITSRSQLQERNVGGQLPMNARDVRRLTVREAARLQSFPDTHVFTGSKTNQYKQVGNAVPPKLGYHIGRHLRTEVLKQ